LYPTPAARRLNIAASASLVALIVLGVAWEMWLAPLRPGGSWLVIKVLPLLMPLFGILRGRRYTHQWASMLSLAYMMEGIVRATTETGVSQLLAVLEVTLSMLFFGAAVFYARLTSPTSPAARSA
jgi:uncharacterized membrane protein